jgi:hypothetical protein
MPLEDFTPGWKPVHVGIEGDTVSLDGLRPWKLKWKSLGTDSIVVPHPAHLHERHRAWRYEMEEAGKQVTFAAGELSNGVWGFYVPT